MFRLDLARCPRYAELDRSELSRCLSQPDSGSIRATPALALKHSAARTSPERADCGLNPAPGAIRRPASRRARPDAHTLPNTLPAPDAEAPENWDCLRGRCVGPACLRKIQLAPRFPDGYGWRSACRRQGRLDSCTCAIKS